MYDELFVRLDASFDKANSIETQDKAKFELFEICNASSEDEIAELISGRPPFASRNIIEVLTKLGYPKIRKTISWLLGFLMDINWFGANEAMELLGSMNPEFFKLRLNENLARALKENDGDWVLFTSLFIDDYNLEKHVEPKLYEEMVGYVEKYCE